MSGICDLFILFLLREIQIVLSDSKQHSDIKENIPFYAEKEIFDDNADVHGHTRAMR